MPEKLQIDISALISCLVCHIVCKECAKNSYGSHSFYNYIEGRLRKTKLSVWSDATVYTIFVNFLPLNFFGQSKGYGLSTIIS